MSDGLIIIKTKAAKRFPQSGMATWINQHCKVQTSISSKNISMIVWLSHRHKNDVILTKFKVEPKPERKRTTLIKSGTSSTEQKKNYSRNAYVM